MLHFLIRVWQLFKSWSFYGKIVVFKVYLFCLAGTHAIFCLDTFIMSLLREMSIFFHSKVSFTVLQKWFHRVTKDLLPYILTNIDWTTDKFIKYMLLEREEWLQRLPLYVLPLNVKRLPSFDKRRSSRFLLAYSYILINKHKSQWILYGESFIIVNTGVEILDI